MQALPRNEHRDTWAERGSLYLCLHKAQAKNMVLSTFVFTELKLKLCVHRNKADRFSVHGAQTEVVCSQK